MKNKNQRKILIIIIAITLILDHVSKIIAFRQGLVTNHEPYENRGYYAIMSIIVIIMIIRYISNENSFIKLDTKIILSLGISGLVGNLIDRIWNKNVIVFMKINNSFEFNFAYVYIIIAWVGMAAILAKNTMKILRERKGNKNENKSKWRSRRKKNR